MIRYVLLYLLWPLPILWAKGRRDLEMEAYAESIRATKEYYGDALLLTDSYRERMISHFTGGAYLWMWVSRKAVEKWYDDTVKKLTE